MNSTNNHTNKVIHVHMIKPKRPTRQDLEDMRELSHIAKMIYTNATEREINKHIARRWNITTEEARKHSPETIDLVKQLMQTGAIKIDEHDNTTAEQCEHCKAYRKLLMKEV